MSNIEPLKIHMDMDYEDRVISLMTDLRLFGVNFEDTNLETIKEHKFYYSVPEKVETPYITMDGEEYKKFVKNKIIELTLTGVEDFENQTEEYLNIAKAEIEKDTIFLSKIRHGDIWTIQNVLDEIVKIRNEDTYYEVI